MLLLSQDFNEHSFVDLEAGATPSSPQLNKLMHQAMAIVNHLLHDLEKDKGQYDQSISGDQSQQTITPISCTWDLIGWKI